MQKLYIWMTIPLLLLSGCGRPSVEIDVQDEEKQAYYITTSSVEELTTLNTITKSGRLVGAQAITVSSLVPGRVKRIAYENGETLGANTTVVELNDTSGSFSFNAQRAKAQLDSARINYEQTATNLNKAIDDSSRGVKQAQTQLNASSQDGGGSANLQIQQLDQQVNKAELDYQTQLTSNQQTLDNFFATAKNLAKDVELLYTNVVNENDKILGVSNNYKTLNDAYEQKLGAKNTVMKRLAEQTLKDLIQQETLYNNIAIDITKDNLANKLITVEGLAKRLQPLLDQTEEVLTLTNSSDNTLPEAQLNGLKATIDGLQAQVQGQVSGITQQINSIESFLATYKDQEESLRKQVDITKQQIATTKSNLQDSEANAGIGIESAQSNYENALKSKGTTLASLSNSIEQARIAYSEAQTQLGKFSVSTPINGSLGEILVDVGQEVNPGTPLFTVSSSNEQQVEIALTEEELNFVKTGDEVNVDINGEERTGSIQSISRTADENFTYKTVISLNGTTSLFGDVVDVKIPVRTAYPLVPLNVVSILKRNEGIINIWESNEVQPVKVGFGKVWGSNVEITSDLDPNTILIVSDINNFNPNTQEIELSLQP